MVIQIFSVKVCSETIYVYADSTPAEVKSMEITYTANGQTKTETDLKHPFEFTLPYSDDFTFTAKLILPDGNVYDIPETKVHK